MGKELIFYPITEITKESDLHGTETAHHGRKDRYRLHASRRLLPAGYFITRRRRKQIGVWGQRHAAFLKKHQRNVYDEFFFSGKLNAYLAQIDRDAQEMFDLLVRQFAEQEGVTEAMKAEIQMEWVQKINSIRNRATEIVNHELILA